MGVPSSSSGAFRMTTGSPCALRTTTSNPARGTRPSSCVSAATSRSCGESVGTAQVYGRPIRRGPPKPARERPSRKRLAARPRRSRPARHDLVHLLTGKHTVELVAGHPLDLRARLQQPRLRLELVVLLAEHVDVMARGRYLPALREVRTRR